MLALGTPRPHIHEQIIACVFAAVAVRRASRLLLRVAPIRCCGSEPCKHCLQMPCKYCFQKDDEWKTHVILFYVSRGLVLHIYRNTYVAMPYVYQGIHSGMCDTADFPCYLPVITANKILMLPTGNYRYRGGSVCSSYPSPGVPCLALFVCSSRLSRVLPSPQLHNCMVA